MKQGQSDSGDARDFYLTYWPVPFALMELGTTTRRSVWRSHVV